MPTHTILPGVNALGSGFNPFLDNGTKFRPSLLSYDFDGDSAQYQNANFAGTFQDYAKNSYSVPKGITINPGGLDRHESSNTYTSRQEVEESFAVKAGIEGGFGLFSGSVNASYNTSTRATQDSYFSTMSTRVTLWTMSLAENLLDLRETVNATFLSDANALPNGHGTDAEREKWDAFFDHYGTHYIASCEVGGHATLSVTMQKSDKTTKQSMAADVTIEYGSYFKGTGSVGREKTSKNFQQNKHVTKSSNGGEIAETDPENDENALLAWAKTVKDAPAPRDYTMRPIWKLFPDKAVADAAEAAFADYCYRNSQYCVKFAETDANVDITKQNGFSGFEQMCVEAWIYPTGKGAAGHGGIIVNKEHAFELARFADGTLRHAIETNDGAKWKWHDTKAKVPQDMWTHVALTLGKHQSKPGYYVDAFINGNRVDRTDLTGPVKENTNKMSIGDRALAQQGFQGFMQEVRMWNVQRSVHDIQNAMYERLTGDEPGLVGLWTLNDAHANTVRDLSPHGNTGKLRKATWAVPPEPSPLTASVTSRMQRTEEMKVILARFTQRLETLPA